MRFKVDIYLDDIYIGEKFVQADSDEEARSRVTDLIDCDITELD